MNCSITACTHEHCLKNSELLQKTNQVDTDEEDAVHKIQKKSSSMNICSMQSSNKLNFEIATCNLQIN